MIHTRKSGRKRSINAGDKPSVEIDASAGASSI